MSDFTRTLMFCAKGLVAASLLLLFSSCAGMKATVSRQEMDSVDQSMELPSTNITVYDSSLEKLGLMLTAYNVKNIKIYCRPIVNATASKKLPTNVSQLTLTAVSKIGPKVQSIDYDRGQLAVDLARDETTMQRVVPDLAVRGAITEYDKKVEKERELEGDASGSWGGNEFDGGGSADNSSSSSTVAMDYQLLDYKTQMTIPYVQAANRMNLYTATAGKDIGLSIEGSGFGVNCKVKRSQGIHAGLRLLVELNILEIIGKFHNVPYWRCLEDGKPDQRMVKQFIRNIKKDPNVLLTMKTYAYAHGKNMEMGTGGISQAELNGLKALKKQYGLDPDAENDYEFIKLMWLNLPFESCANRIADMPDPAEVQRKAEEALRRAQAAAHAEAAARAENAAEEKAAKKRTTFKFGKQDTF